MEKAGGARSALASFRSAASRVSKAMSLLAFVGSLAVALLPSRHSPNELTVLVPRPALVQANDVSTAALPSAKPTLRVPSPSEVSPSETVAGFIPRIDARPNGVIEVRARKKVRSSKAEPSRQAPDPAPAAPEASPAAAAKQPSVPPKASEPAAPAAQEPAKAEAAPEEPPPWTDAEVAAALRTCLATLAPLGIDLETRPPVREKACGLAAPVAVKHLASGVEMRPAAVVNCAVAAALHEWLTKVAQPAARDVLGSPIVRLSGTGGYSCRNRNGAVTGPISEHAFGNALDISGFVLADGRAVLVQEHWGPVARKSAPVTPAATKEAAKEAAKEGEPSGAPSKHKIVADGALKSSKSALGGPAAPVAEKPAEAVAKPDPLEGKFLRRVHAGACKYFGTVLGPEANEAHHNHLHFDLKPRKRKNFCE
jgi:hypothetical protein